MNWVKSLIIAFSMYSKIPMPHLNLEEKDMRYVMGFFPLVGLVLGACQFIWYKLSAFLGVPNVSRALIFLVLPVIVTGGIHVDGYMDTSDAIHSYGDREKKLSILKDSHIGAFAVIRLLVYSAVYFAALFWMADQGKEPAMKALLKALEKEAVLFAELALGEGTGAVMLFPLLDMAMRVYRENTTFEDIQIEAYEDYKKC